ncbi:type VI secretion protein [Candidatus Magnetomorum sp. HK-1]|nr:type VI secretion protein [Candidatus Magnetomorum sp. HK-1]
MNTDEPINISRSAYHHLLWAMYLLSKKADLSQFRFYAKPGLVITIPEIDHIELSETGLHEVWINFGGIDGINGPLPLWLKEVLSQEYDDARQDSDKKRPLGDFINIFSHRLTYYLYRAWLKHKPFLMFDPLGKDRLSRLLLSLTHQMDIQDNNQSYISNKRLRFLPYVAALGNRSQSSNMLLGMLRHFFKGIPIHIKMFMKRFIDTPEEYQMCMGKRLDGNMILGQRMPDISGAFRIIVGPMKIDDYERFLPNGPYYKDLVHLVQMFVSQFLDWDIELRLLKKQIPRFEIGGKGNHSRLGFNTWLPPTNNHDGVIVIQKKN